MKKLFLILPAVLALFIFSCDKVTDPIVKVEPPANGRKMLLEDFTGQDCPNCPDAADLAKTLKETYNDQLVVIAVHSGGFAKPNATYTNDFRTTAGNTWNSYYAIGLYPAGMINRKKYSEASSVWVSSSKWSSYVSSASRDMYILKLEPTVSYDPKSRALDVSARATFSVTYATNVQICAVLVENGIISAQNKKGEKIDEYEFEHVVRGTISENDIWGRRLKTAPVRNRADTTVRFPSFTVDPKFNDKELSVVVYAFDEKTREVLQVEEVKVP